MSPYRTAAARSSDEWIARRTNMVCGEPVVTYTWHRWLWTARLRAWLWLLFHEWGLVQFARRGEFE